MLPNNEASLTPTFLSFQLMFWWLVACLSATAPLLATAAALTESSTESFFECLLSHSHAPLLESERVDITDIASLKNIDTSYLAKLPTKIIGISTGLWDPTLATGTGTDTEIGNITRGAQLLSMLAMKYGEEIIKWHFAGEGSTQLPLLSRHRDPSMYLKLKEAVRLMLIQEQRGKIVSAEMDRLGASSFTSAKLVKISRPTFFHQEQETNSISSLNLKDMDNTIHKSTDSNQSTISGDNDREDDTNTKCEQRLDVQLANMKLTNHTPLYAMASTGPFMVMESFNNATGENELAEGWPVVLHSSLTEKMSTDGVFSKSSIESTLPIFNEKYDDIDIYFATHMSGTHFHSHGATVTSTTGTKLWMLFSPVIQCRLLSLKSQELTNIGLAPMCSEHSNDKYTTNQTCFGQFHPLEIFRKYEEMQQLGIAPRLMLQHPGEILVLPEDWMHGTINLELGVSVSYRFPRKQNEDFCTSIVVDSIAAGDEL